MRLRAGTDASGAAVLLTDPAHTWHAAAELDAKAAASSLGGANRNIVIGNVNATVTAASNFVWAALPTSAQTALMATPYGAANATDNSTVGSSR